MANHPLKFLASFLQIRTLHIKPSKILTETLKPTAAAALTGKIRSKSDKKEAKLSKNKESVIALLKEHEFTDAQIAKVVEKHPGILRSKFETTLVPKLKFLNENGFKGSFLAEIIAKNPLILRQSLEAHMVPTLGYLREFMQDDEAALMFVVNRACWLLTLDIRKILQPNFDLLLKEGVVMRNLLKVFTVQPRPFLVSPVRMRFAIEWVKKFGVRPSEPMFLHAVRVVLSMNELNLMKKVEVLKSLGWSDEDIMSTVAQYPLCLTHSEEKLKKAFEFFVQTMKVEQKMIIKYPKLLMYSLEKRSIPRCKVVMELKKKELLKNIGIPTLMNLPEKDFVNKFVLKYQELAPDVLLLYPGLASKDAGAGQQ